MDQDQGTHDAPMPRANKSAVQAATHTGDSNLRSGTVRHTNVTHILTLDHPNQLQPHLL